MGISGARDAQLSFVAEGQVQKWSGAFSQAMTGEVSENPHEATLTEHFTILICQLSRSCALRLSNVLK